MLTIADKGKKVVHTRIPKELQSYRIMFVAIRDQGTIGVFEHFRDDAPCCDKITHEPLSTYKLAPPPPLSEVDRLREQVRILREALAPSKDLLEHIVQRLSDGVQFWNTDMQAMRSRIASIREALEATKEGE